MKRMWRGKPGQEPNLSVHVHDNTGVMLQYCMRIVRHHRSDSVDLSLGANRLSFTVEQAVDIAAALQEAARGSVSAFYRGDRVCKKSGSAWQGIVVGEYSTDLTQEGYAVESEAHPGSVQIYPASALEIVKE